MLIACPSCQRQLNVPENAAGKQVRCPAPDCGTVFFVPAAPAAAASPAPSAVQAPAPRPAAPRPAAPRPIAPAQPQPQAGGAPFDFGGAAGPQSDFGFTDHTDGGLKGIGVRTRIGRAAGWLNLSGGSMIAWILLLVTLVIFLTVPGWMGITMQLNERGFNGAMVGVGAVLALLDCSPFLLLPIPMVVIIAARMFGRSRRWGVAMTGSIISIVIGGLAVLCLIAFAIQTVMAWMGAGLMAAHGHGSSGIGAFIVIVSCTNLVVVTIVAFCGIFGGIVGIRTLLNKEVQKTFA